MSIIEISARNVPQLYTEGFWKFRVFAEEEKTRNGAAMVMPEPCYLKIDFPEERVLTDPVRDANPFFHVMEFVWMIAERNDAGWISQFNKRMLEYADSGVLRGAYGWRWANPSSQLRDTIDLLRRDPFTRQAVLAMWDPVYDGSRASTSDRPCNTHIYFRIRETDDLDMTVCNRSNDFVWGAMGANAVHMTLLHELVARASGYKLGEYRVFVNNLHIYKDLPNYEAIYATSVPYDCYRGPKLCNPFHLLTGGATFEDFQQDCKDLCNGRSPFLTEWGQHVAYPIHQAYLDRKNREEWINKIAAEDWRKACREWNERRLKNKKKTH